MGNRKTETLGARVRFGLRRFVRDRRGNITAMMALLIVPLVGLMGLATETGSWYMIHRGAQNAADAAVLAAGQNGHINAGGITYIDEGRQVATKFGFVHGAPGTNVSVVKSQACPAPLAGPRCYRVTVSRNVPISLVKILGYSGTGGSGLQNITASAMAGPKDVITEYCVLALSPTGEGIRLNGAPTADFSGCNFMANSTSVSNGHPAANCNGSSFIPPDIVSAAGTADPGCGVVAYSGATPIADPYASKAAANASDLNATSCGGVFTAHDIASLASGAVNTECGPVRLTANISVTSNTVLVIQNGTLDLNGHTLSTTAGAGLSLVFNTTTGKPNTAPFANNSGTLDFAAPTSGPWSGVAIYQNRQNGSAANLTQTFAGNTPTWDITGLVYLPYIDLDFKGIVNKSSFGHTCFALVSYTFQISGNGAIYDNPMSQCIQAGLVLPNNIVTSRITLVQ